jgi:hypothetical protein
MNKENAKDYLPLVQALAEGKTIQVAFHFGTNDVRWEDMDEFSFCDPAERYRIKPEPRRRCWNEPKYEIPKEACNRRVKNTNQLKI